MRVVVPVFVAVTVPRPMPVTMVVAVAVFVVVHSLVFYVDPSSSCSLRLLSLLDG